jgi:acyl dehydratase
VLGQQVRTEVSPKRLLADVEGLKEEAVHGDLQIVHLDNELEAKLREYVGND